MGRHPAASQDMQAGVMCGLAFMVRPAEGLLITNISHSTYSDGDQYNVVCLRPVRQMFGARGEIHVQGITCQ